MDDVAVVVRLDTGHCPDMSEIKEASLEAVRIEREGAGPGSLTEEGLRYSVLDGQGCLKHAPRLCWWVLHALPALASAATGIPLIPLRKPQSMVNINVLMGRGEQYELHTDSVPWTAILFVTGPHRGGELRIDRVTGDPIYVHPEPGLLAIFQGEVWPHAVMPMQEDGMRVSVPVSMIEVGEQFERDPNVDAHLYETAV